MSEKQEMGTNALSPKAKTKLSLIFLLVVGVSLAVYAFWIADVKSTSSDLEGMLGCLALGWLMGWYFYRFNIFGVKSRTPQEFARLIGWSRSRPTPDASPEPTDSILGTFIRKIALAVFIGMVIAFVFLYWASH